MRLDVTAIMEAPPGTERVGDEYHDPANWRTCLNCGVDCPAESTTCFYCGEPN